MMLKINISQAIKNNWENLNWWNILAKFLLALAQFDYLQCWYCFGIL
jgi:hypothetical protein